MSVFCILTVVATLACQGEKTILRDTDFFFVMATLHYLFLFGYLSCKFYYFYQFLSISDRLYFCKICVCYNFVHVYKFITNLNYPKYLDSVNDRGSYSITGPRYEETNKSKIYAPLRLSLGPLTRCQHQG